MPDPVPTIRTNYVFFLSHTGVNVPAETPVTRCNLYRFPRHKNTHLEDGNGYPDELLFFQLFAYWNNFDFEQTYGQRGGDQILMVSLRVAQNGPETRSTMYNYECFNTTPLGRYETIAPGK